MILILWVSVNPLVFAQEYTGGDSTYSDLITGSATEAVTAPGDSPYNVGDLFSSDEGDGAEGGKKSLLDKFLSKNAQKTLFKVFEHGSKALKAAKIGRNVYKSLTGKRLNPALQGISDILVLYGVIDPPTKTANADGSTPDGQPTYKGPNYDDNPDLFDLEPDSPRNVYAIARNARAISEAFYENLSGIVLSEEGQQVRQAEQEADDLAQEETVAAHESIIEIVGVSEEQAAANVTAAEQVQVIGAEAQGDKSAQSVMKRLALQQAYGSGISAQTSQQLAGLTASAGHQNRSLSALANLAQVQNRKLSKLEILAASGNKQRAQNNFLIEAQKHGDDLKQDIQAASTRNTILTPQIPGLGDAESE